MRTIFFFFNFHFKILSFFIFYFIFSFIGFFPNNIKNIFFLSKWYPISIIYMNEMFGGGGGCQIGGTTPIFYNVSDKNKNNNILMGGGC